MDKQEHQQDHWDIALLIRGQDKDSGRMMLLMSYGGPDRADSMNIHVIDRLDAVERNRLCRSLENWFREAGSPPGHETPSSSVPPI